ncbi:Zinc metalloproteinase nas-14 [Liparis tanakae]|uniref:Metalloendopeptidase n=1 Tax=Liparis tanakae TaxID=230148 RepID=A0A4Z2J4Q0_9TELE|nr:Zinc metalloproteinase nas-14 [Liparis tanakae]
MSKPAGWVCSCIQEKPDHCLLCSGRGNVQQSEPRRVDGVIEEDGRTWSVRRVALRPVRTLWPLDGVHSSQSVQSLIVWAQVKDGAVIDPGRHIVDLIGLPKREDNDGTAMDEIIKANEFQDRLRNFEKFKTESLDLPYDYGSIMHFGMYAYSQDGQPTIVPKNNQNSKDIRLGKASTLSHIDKMKINKLYKCGGKDEY